jgi:Putative transposase of IS4/5 family (DUF4096)
MIREGLPLWTDKNRAKYSRDHLRYPSDLTDDEWAHVERLIPPARRGGGKRRTDMRAVMNGVMYILSTGRSRVFLREKAVALRRTRRSSRTHRLQRV